MTLIIEDETQNTIKRKQAKNIAIPIVFRTIDLGHLPKEWERKKLWEIATEIGDGIHATPNYVDSSDCYFINGNNLKNDKIVITKDTKFVSRDEYESHKKKLNDHTILMSINGTIGELAYFNNEKIILGKSVAYINLKKNVSKKFIYYILQHNSVKEYCLNELTGTTIKNLSLKSIREIPIPLPCPEEQEAIAAALSDVDTLIFNLEKQLNKARNLKRGMIQELLTGRIRLT